MAAGGITDNRTAKAAHALGAEGVFAGSVFIGTEESRVPQSVKDKIIEANGLDLLLSVPCLITIAHSRVNLPRSLLRWTKQAQVMKSWVKQWGLRGLRIGMLEGNSDEGYIALGTGIGNIRCIKSVAEVVNELTVS